MGPRIFTVLEANNLLPELTAIFNEIDAVRAKLKEFKGKLDVLEMIWGEEISSDTNPDRREYEHFRSEIEQYKKRFDKTANRFGDLEIVPKGLEAGLIDFYSVVNSRLVFLCWKRGEEKVEWYHDLETGFSARQEIPAELLDHGR